MGKFIEFNQGCSALFNDQFQLFISRILIQANKGHLSLPLSIKASNTARLLKCNEQEFHHTSLKSQMECFLGSTNITELDSLQEMEPWSLILLNPAYKYKNEYIQRGKILSECIKREDIYVLFLAMILLSSKNPEISPIHSYTSRALIKKIGDYSEFRGWNEPQEAVRALFKNLMNFGAVLQEFVAKGIPQMPPNPQMQAMMS